MSEGAAHRPDADLRVLDALRGLAAGYVVIGHASALLWRARFQQVVKVYRPKSTTAWLITHQSR